MVHFLNVVRIYDALKSSKHAIATPPKAKQHAILHLYCIHLYSSLPQENQFKSLVERQMATNVLKRHYCSSDSVHSAWLYIASISSFNRNYINTKIENESMSYFHSVYVSTQLTQRSAWKLLGMLELIVGWLFWTIKHANKWLITSNCHFNATFQASHGRPVTVLSQSCHSPDTVLTQPNSCMSDKACDGRNVTLKWQ